MAQEDYPYCVFCEAKITNVEMQEGEAVYSCSCCGESVRVSTDG